MKKFVLILLIFALFFIGCDDGGNDVNADIIGTWTGNYNTGYPGFLTLSITGDKSWLLTFDDALKSIYKSSFNGTWSRSGNSITLKYSTGSNIIAEIINNKLILTIPSDFLLSTRPGSIELTKSGSIGNTSDTTLKIKNESSKTIYDVLWTNITFSENTSDIIGTWIGTYSGNANHPAGEIEVEISSNSWIIVFKDIDSSVQSSNGKLAVRRGNIQYLFHPNYDNYCGNASFIDNKMILNITEGAAVDGYGNQDNRFLFPLPNRRETYELTRIGDAFKSGTSVTKSVEAGSGYIFFKIGSTAYRTQNAVTVEKDKNEEFTFTDYTIVIVLDSGTTKTLGGL